MIPGIKSSVYYRVLVPGTMSGSKNRVLLITKMLTHGMQMNQQKEKAGVHNMDLQKTWILDQILLLSL